MPKQDSKPADYPQAVLQQIELLGQNIAVARKRRGETQTQWARRLGVSQPTMARMERGDPSVAMVSYVMCMWLVNPAVAVADLISPLNDHAALEREVLRARKPRKPRKTPQKSVLLPADSVDTTKPLDKRRAADVLEPLPKSSAWGVQKVKSTDLRGRSSKERPHNCVKGSKRRAHWACRKLKSTN